MIIRLTHGSTYNETFLKYKQIQYQSICKFVQIIFFPSPNIQRDLLRRTVENVGPLAFEKNNVKTC
jgi:hypothetical protein